MTKTSELTDALAAWVEDYVDAGWTPYLLTFMFDPIGGSPATVARAMEREIERVYATFVTRVVRRPTAPSSLGLLPIWLCCPDYPVYKRKRACLRDVLVNDGLHHHGLGLQPPWSRLRESVADHFNDQNRLYVDPSKGPLSRIDVEPITHDAGYVTKYGFKAIESKRADFGASLVLPRTMHEAKSAYKRFQSEDSHADFKKL